MNDGSFSTWRPEHGAAELLQVEPSRPLVPSVRAVPARRAARARRPTRTGARTKCSRSSKRPTAGSRSISARSTRSATRSAASSRTVRSHVPPGFKEAWKALFEAGWRTLAIEEKHGGQAGPFTLAMMVEEFMCGSCTSFNMYPGAHAGRGRRDPRVRHARATGALRRRRCSTARGPARCA